MSQVEGEGDKWYELLGHAEGDSVIVEYLLRHGIDVKAADVKQFGNGTTVYNFYSHGISLAFENKLLDSIDFFVKDKRFKSVDKSLVLPLGITLETTGKELVEKFKEPLEKGGAMNSKIDIWLRWPNFQIDLDDRSWETAQNAKWNSLTIF
jgi:hypothetical protein